MRTARRLYVYVIAGIGLTVLAIGLTQLLSVLLDALGLRGGQELFGGDQAIRERLTLASALTAVALPVWLIHWYVAERGVRPDQVEAQVERESVIRALYFAIAMAALLIAAASSASGLIEGVVLAIASDPTAVYLDVAGSLAVLLVAGAMWTYHVGLRIRDWHRGPLDGAAAWIPRTYFYGAALGGLLTLIFGISGLIEVAGRALLDARLAFSGDDGPWWAFPLATALAQVIVGGAVWMGHWLYSLGLVADQGWRGRTERPARLRLAYFLSVIVVGAIGVVGYVGESGHQLMASLLGVSDVRGGSLTAAAVILPSLSAALFGAAWWIHARWMRGEAMAAEDHARLVTADRLDDYALSLVGLGFGAVAAGWLVGLLIEAVLGGGRTISGAGFARDELVRFAPIALLGGLLWLWRWSRIRASRAASPSLEAASTIRRVMLLIVLAGSILPGLAALGVILYRAFGSIFGAPLSGDAVSELSRPIGALVVAASVAAYHGLALRRDQGLRAGDAQTQVAMDDGAQPGGVRQRDTAVLILRLSGPPDTDLLTTLHALREQLPPGYALDQLPPATER